MLSGLSAAPFVCAGPAPARVVGADGRQGAQRLWRDVLDRHGDEEDRQRLQGHLRQRCARAQPQACLLCTHVHRSANKAACNAGEVATVDSEDVFLLPPVAFGKEEHALQVRVPASQLAPAWY